jgi:hypothetical protein
MFELELAHGSIHEHAAADCGWSVSHHTRLERERGIMRIDRAPARGAGGFVGDDRFAVRHRRHRNVAV